MACSIDILKDRALMLQKARMFLVEHGLFEVDCPILNEKASIDPYIDLFSTIEGRFLHSSPEYGMKRLLSLGSGDIFQISHVFRKEELGTKHTPEFMLAEWYRVGMTFDKMIEESVEFIELFLGKQPVTTFTWRQAWQQIVKVDYFKMNQEMLISLAENNRLDLSAFYNESKESLLQILFGFLVEPHLGKRGLCVIKDYPASQAALSKIVGSGEHRVAKRFEIFCNGIELANGYDELLNSKEQLDRFIQANVNRVTHHKDELPIDDRFLRALEKGVPSCCGVAVGFDRLMMLRHHVTHINEVLPFGWEES